MSARRTLVVALVFVPLAATLFDCKPLTEVATDPDFPKMYSCYDDDSDYTKNGTCCVKQCPTDMLCAAGLTDTDPCPASTPTAWSNCTLPTNKYCYYGLSHQNLLGEQLTVPMFTEVAQCGGTLGSYVYSDQWLVVAHSASSNTCNDVKDAYEVECCGADRTIVTNGPQGATTCGALRTEFRTGGCCPNR